MRSAAVCCVVPFSCRFRRRGGKTARGRSRPAPPADSLDPRSAACPAKLSGMTRRVVAGMPIRLLAGLRKGATKVALEKGLDAPRRSRRDVSGIWMRCAGSRTLCRRRRWCGFSQTPQPAALTATQLRPVSTRNRNAYGQEIIADIMSSAAPWNCRTARKGAARPRGQSPEIPIIFPARAGIHFHLPVRASRTPVDERLCAGQWLWNPNR